MVQVAGSLNVPTYQWPLKGGIACLLLAPVAFGVRELGLQGFGRAAGIILILKFVGPIGFLVLGILGLGFAMSVRMAKASVRKELEDLGNGFVIITRQGPREYRDDEVEAIGFRSRTAASGSVSTQKGQARLWVNGSEGAETIPLEWEYPDGSDDPLGEFLQRMNDRLLAQSLRTIDSGGTVEGDGWSLSRPGLQVGEAFDILGFNEVSAVEYHDSQLQVWKVGDVEPCFKVAEGSKNESVLAAILELRKSNRVEAVPTTNEPGEGLGRVLFERRPKLSERFAYWGLALFVSGISVLMAAVMIQSGYSIGFGLMALVAVVLSFLVALNGQQTCFRFHERGLSRSGLFGVRSIPFDDLAEVQSTLMSYETLLRMVFKPIKGRGLKKISVDLPATDPARETIHAYIPAEKFGVIKAS